MVHSVIYRVTCAALLLAAPLAVEAGGKLMKSFSETLTVASSGGRVLVTVVLDNPNGQPMHVPNAIATDKELFGRLFEIRDTATGKPVEYQGPMVKRGPLTADDYFTVAPGTRHSNTLDITDSYAFKPGHHTYQLSYAGYAVPDLGKPEGTVRVSVPPVSFTFRGESPPMAGR
ncbi:hypothetical protein GJ700_25885 [Duganella sp. FT92W]|uniref:Uncharacterized protein n=1 Tax=Pseudoduganella rivuli TaxID=2666085 RepID=A0A7X2LV68_9BURK|nr:hypothetical protein [Pseudoduganella rivuli]MRV75151.1 hypothetical protein [Pseudoduganella rivuli]